MVVESALRHDGRPLDTTECYLLQMAISACILYNIGEDRGKTFLEGERIGWLGGQLLMTPPLGETTPDGGEKGEGWTERHYLRRPRSLGAGNRSCSHMGVRREGNGWERIFFPFPLSSYRRNTKTS